MEPPTNAPLKCPFPREPSSFALASREFIEEAMARSGVLFDESAVS
jgi:hypothetical protein